MLMTTESTVETDEFVSTVEIPTDVGDLSQSAQLDVNDLPVTASRLDAEGKPGIGFQFGQPGRRRMLPISFSMRSRTAWA